MTVTGQNFTMYKGDSKTITFTVRDSAGAIVDITGATAKWQMAVSPFDTAVITKATGGSGISLTDPTNGVFEVTVNPSDTATLDAVKYYHEAEVIDAAGTVSTVAVGNVTLKEDLIASSTP